MCAQKARSIGGGFELFYHGDNKEPNGGGIISKEERLNRLTWTRKY